MGKSGHKEWVLPVEPACPAKCASEVQPTRERVTESETAWRGRNEQAWQMANTKRNEVTTQRMSTAKLGAAEHGR